MPAPVSVTLSEEEDRTLRELSCADGVPCRTRQRATALRLSNQGWKVCEIASYLNWIEQTVRETIGRWEGKGLGGLWEAPGRGRHRRWNEEDWQALEQWANEPRRYSAQQLRHKLEVERQVQLGSEQVRRILKKRLTFGNATVPLLPAVQMTLK
jgi:transposase